MSVTTVLHSSDEHDDVNIHAAIVFPNSDGYDDVNMPIASVLHL
jgi:hypothetical protein